MVKLGRTDADKDSNYDLFDFQGLSKKVESAFVIPPLRKGPERQNPETKIDYDKLGKAIAINLNELNKSSKKPDKKTR